MKINYMYTLHIQNMCYLVMFKNTTFYTCTYDFYKL